ncbi:hypothetical protein PARPLA_02243 [Rhodobacteraceae bacterium THAF1]|uniref:DUF2484 family protein n=1 Tax=Palleronia sp. THAF1 TaxID=2587842 RepID=UPI000F3FA8CA|nr:DUF2484 family protein [Palleronia sp. THAF1]QFU09279.1 hypothetical protein FIU81_11395 [Palleronia sp. THAF1]VDC26598.1 hypothetical protein PARPLA_02243 [Rhodobacteraceae bacterium THAF1]
MAVILGCIWVLVANGVAMLPSRDHHWTAAYVLIGIGVPLLVWIVASAGFWTGLIFFAAGVSILRWPFVYLARWFGRLTGARQ